MKKAFSTLGEGMARGVQWLQEAGCPEWVAEFLAIVLPTVVSASLLYGLLIGLLVLLFTVN